jgi:hypothetical protein
MTQQTSIINCRPGEIFNAEIRMTNTGSGNWPAATTFCRQECTNENDIKNIFEVPSSRKIAPNDSCIIKI